MRRKRGWRRVALALVAVAVLGTMACGRGGEGPVEIVIWDQMDPSESAKLLEHLRAYESAHPGVRVLRSQYETEVLRTQFQTAATAGGGPDLVYGPSDQVGPFSVLRIIRPLDGLIPADSLRHFHAASFDTLDGHIWALPDQLGNHLCLLYNRARVPQPPQTLDELMVVAQAQTADADGDGRPERYGLVFNATEPFWLVPFLGAFGGWVMDAQHRPTLDTPAMVAALRYLDTLKNERGAMPREIDVQLADTMFKEGRAAMILNGPWSFAAYRNAGIDLGIARIPRDAASGRWATPMVGSKGYSINASVPDAKLPHVLDLLYYLTSAPVTADYAELLILPSRLEALEVAARGGDALLAASRAQFDVGRRMPVVPEMRAVWDAMRPPLQQVLSRDLTPEEAAARMQRDAEAKIAAMRR